GEAPRVVGGQFGKVVVFAFFCCFGGGPRRAPRDPAPQPGERARVSFTFGFEVERRRCPRCAQTGGQPDARGGNGQQLGLVGARLVESFAGHFQRRARFAAGLSRDRGPHGRRAAVAPEERQRPFVAFGAAEQPGVFGRAGGDRQHFEFGGPRGRHFDRF